MKKFGLVAILLIAMLNILGAQEKYELTEVDIFSLERPFLGIEVSVLGISLGDSMDAVLKKLNKKKKDLEKYKMGYYIDFEDSMRIHFSLDTKLVIEVTVKAGFASNLKGKTVEYFDLSSLERMKSFVEESFGKPDYVYHKAVAGLVIHDTFYLDGFSFWFAPGEMKLAISDKDRLLSMVEIFGAKRVEKAEGTIEVSRPKISTTGFRKVLWGMSAEQAKEIETAEFVKKEKGGGDFKGLDILIYTTNISGLDCTVVYYFADNMLTRARYLITEEHTNKNLYIEDFLKIKNQLVEKYGSPDKDDTIWSDDLYKDDPSEHGMALSVGHLMYVAEWYLPETIIQLLLKGDNYSVTLWVEYVGADFREFEKMVRKKAQEDIW